MATIRTHRNLEPPGFTPGGDAHAPSLDEGRAAKPRGGEIYHYDALRLRATLPHKCMAADRRNSSPPDRCTSAVAVAVAD